MFEFDYFIIGGVFSYIFDTSINKDLYKTCSDISTQSFHLIHHIINFFLLFGWISKSRVLLKYHIYLTLCVLFLWRRDGRCFMTHYTNTKCSIKGYFRDILYALNLKEYQLTYTYVSLVISLSKLYL